MFGLNAESLRYKWEAMSFNSTRSISIFTMDSCTLIKEQLQRGKAAELAKLTKAASSSFSAGRGGRGSMLKRGSGRKALDGALKVGFAPGSRIAGDDKRNIAGPSKVTFKGPKYDETSRKQRACELCISVASCGMLISQTGTCTRRSQREAKSSMTG